MAECYNWVIFVSGCLSESSIANIATSLSSPDVGPLVVPPEGEGWVWLFPIIANSQSWVLPGRVWNDTPSPSLRGGGRRRKGRRGEGRWTEVNNLYPIRSNTILSMRSAGLHCHSTMEKVSPHEWLQRLKTEYGLGWGYPAAFHIPLHPNARFRPYIGIPNLIHICYPRNWHRNQQIRFSYDPIWHSCSHFPTWKLGGRKVCPIPPPPLIATDWRLASFQDCRHCTSRTSHLEDTGRSALRQFLPNTSWMFRKKPRW